MKISTVYECKVSGGTDRLLIHLIKNWPDKADTWEVICYSRNSGLKLINNELREIAKISTFSQGKNIDALIEYLYTKGKTCSVIAKLVKKLSLGVISFLQLIYFGFLFKKTKPDILYLQQGGYPGAISEHIAGIAAKLINKEIKVITSFQNLPALRHIKPLAIIEDRLTNFYTDSYIFASEHTFDSYSKLTKLKLNSSNIVFDGVEANFSGKKFSNNSDKVHIGMISCYEKRKGHIVLFEAIKLLREQGLTNFYLHCYGQSNFGEYNYIVNYAIRLGLKDLISWHEFEPDFDKLYGHLDIIVQPSIFGESMPLVSIDSAAYYKPIIASRLQGLQEVIEHDTTGYLFNISDHVSLASYLKELISSPDKRKRMGEAARERYEKYFSATRMAKDYYELFLKEMKK